MRLRGRLEWLGEEDASLAGAGKKAGINREKCETEKTKAVFRCCKGQNVKIL